MLSGARCSAVLSGAELREWWQDPTDPAWSRLHSAKPRHGLPRGCLREMKKTSTTRYNEIQRAQRAQRLCRKWREVQLETSWRLDRLDLPVTIHLPSSIMRFMLKLFAFKPRICAYVTLSHCFLVKFVLIVLVLCCNFFALLSHW